MIRTLLDLLDFINTNAGFLVSLIFWTFITIRFSKEIKRHAKLLYWVFGIISFLALLPIFNMAGLNLINVMSIPVLGNIFIELTYSTYFIHPILVIIMYMGAFSPKITSVGRLMTRRKELSIIVGFPVIVHTIKRIPMAIFGSWNYFTESGASTDVDANGLAEFASFISNFVFMLGVVMAILFLVLWITSFDSVHRKLGAKRWKSVQRWSYALYAMLFIHAVGIDAGILARHYSGEQTAQEKVMLMGAQEKKPAHGEMQMPTVAKSPKNESHGGRPSAAHNMSKRFSFRDMKLSVPAKYIFNIFIVFAVYGSYLYFRLRKRRADRERRSKSKIN